MLLQLALDAPAHLAVVDDLRDVVDIVEIGTPLLKRFGLSAISTVREIAPNVPVLADTKTVDGGKFEAEMVFAAGATFMTVLSCAPEATHTAVGEVAADLGGWAVPLLHHRLGPGSTDPSGADAARRLRLRRGAQPADVQLAGDASTAHMEVYRQVHPTRTPGLPRRRHRSRHLRRRARRGSRNRRRRRRHHRGAPSPSGSMDAREAQRQRPWLAVGTQEVTEGVSRASTPILTGIRARELARGERRWFFTGQGRSGLVAQMASMRFMHLGSEVHVLGEATAASVRADDGLVLISSSGETQVSVIYRIAMDEGARVLALTQNSASTLAEITDVVLPIPTLDTQQFGGSLFEQACLLILDSVLRLPPTPTAHSRRCIADTPTCNDPQK